MLGFGCPLTEPEKTLDRLKEQLLRGGSPPSIAPRPWTEGSVRPEAEAAYQRIRPFAEAMYLVMSSDGALDERERNTLRGALRSLTSGALGTSAMAAMLSEFEQLLERDGLELRLDDVAARLYPEREDRELALVLAATVAIADEHFAGAERETIVSLSQRLGVTKQRLEALLCDAGD
jgi:tellurite resistance protein